MQSHISPPSTGRGCAFHRSLYLPVSPYLVTCVESVECFSQTRRLQACKTSAVSIFCVFRAMFEKLYLVGPRCTDLSLWRKLCFGENLKRICRPKVFVYRESHVPRAW